MEHVGLGTLYRRGLRVCTHCVLQPLGVRCMNQILMQQNTLALWSCGYVVMWSCGHTLHCNECSSGDGTYLVMCIYVCRLNWCILLTPPTCTCKVSSPSPVHQFFLADVITSGAHINVFVFFNRSVTLRE